MMTSESIPMGKIAKKAVYRSVFLTMGYIALLNLILLRMKALNDNNIQGVRKKVHL